MNIRRVFPPALPATPRVAGGILRAVGGGIVRPGWKPGAPAGRMPAATPGGRAAGASRAQSAFTMVEIALALAVIGFALVAIIGVLPEGLKVQRENREETIINQDAQVWLDALRSGARGYDDLTNYVEAIYVDWAYWTVDGARLGSGRDAYYPTNSAITSITPPPFLLLTNGFRIIGLLSTPKYSEYRPSIFDPVTFRSNHVTAYVRALSGAATEKFPQDNPDVRELSFRYRLVSEVVPFARWDTNWVRFDLASTNEFAARSNYWWVAKNLHANLHDVRLLFRWPILPNGDTGNGRQVFRAMTSGHYTNFGPFFFVAPRSYVQVN